MLHACLGFKGIKDFISSIKRLIDEMLLEKKKPDFTDFSLLLLYKVYEKCLLLEYMLNRFTVSKPCLRISNLN